MQDRRRETYNFSRAVLLEALANAPPLYQVPQRNTIPVLS